MEIIEVEKKYSGKIKWNIIRCELTKQLGKFYCIEFNNEKVYIDEKFIKEFTGSESTKNASKTIKHFKASLIEYIKEIIGKANSIFHEANNEDKHTDDAKDGWDKYVLGFNYHTIDEFGNKIIKEYEGTIVIRCDDDKKYLYDIVGIKKRACNSHKM